MNQALKSGKYKYKSGQYKYNYKSGQYKYKYKSGKYKYKSGKYKYKSGKYKYKCGQYMQIGKKRAKAKRFAAIGSICPGQWSAWIPPKKQKGQN